MRVENNNAKSARIIIDYTDVNLNSHALGMYSNFRLWAPPKTCHICYLGCRINTAFAGITNLELCIGNKEYAGASRTTYGPFDSIAPRQKIDSIKFLKMGTVWGLGWTSDTVSKSDKFTRKTHGEIINTTDFGGPAFKTLTDESRIAGNPGTFCPALQDNKWNPIGSGYKEFWANFIGTFGTLTAGEAEFVWIYAER